MHYVYQCLWLMKTTPLPSTGSINSKQQEQRLYNQQMQHEYHPFESSVHRNFRIQLLLSFSMELPNAFLMCKSIADLHFSTYISKTVSYFVVRLIFIQLSHFEKQWSKQLQFDNKMPIFKFDLHQDFGKWQMPIILFVFLFPRHSDRKLYSWVKSLAERKYSQSHHQKWCIIPKPIKCQMKGWHVCCCSNLHSKNISSIFFFFLKI